MTADLHSVPVTLLQREIKKIAARINRWANNAGDKLIDDPLLCAALPPDHSDEEVVRRRHPGA